MAYADYKRKLGLSRATSPNGPECCAECEIECPEVLEEYSCKISFENAELRRLLYQSSS